MIFNQYDFHRLRTDARSILADPIWTFGGTKRFPLAGADAPKNITCDKLSVLPRKSTYLVYPKDSQVFDYRARRIGSTRSNRSTYFE